MALAAEKGRIEVIPLLLKAGADVDLQSKVGAILSRISDDDD